ncbi:MAG: response regulator [Thermodesulfobacteriota bacterium]|nr:response regulator [Thermodesulfobacteriota bacterium]
MNGRILLVDDNEEFLDSTRDVLDDEGYDIVTAASGEDGIELASSQIFDVVLMDIKMPGMNGVESFIEMKRRNPKIKVIMVTAYSVEDLIRQALDDGVFAVLSKPVDMDRLFRTIEDTKRDGKGCLVLAVDDDKEICNNFVDILGDRGYEVTAAYDGEEAVTKAKTNIFDILLLDMNLPLLNGLEVYRSIKSIQPNMVAILVSGYAQEMDSLIMQTLNENAHTFLRKPVNMKQLLGLVEGICFELHNNTYHKPGGDRP